jgi:hypothetical protein
MMVVTAAVIRGSMLGLAAATGLLAVGSGQALTGTEQKPARVISAGQRSVGSRLPTQTIRGKVLWGSLETAIETQDGTMYAFATKSSVARRIFAVCGADDLCEVEGTLEGGDTIETVKKVRKLGGAAGVGPK